MKKREKKNEGSGVKVSVGVRVVGIFRVKKG